MIKNTIVIILLSLIFVLSRSVLAQNAKYFRERVNATLIGQTESFQDRANRTTFGDLYLNWQTYKDSNNFSIGPYMIAGLSENKDTAGYYGHTEEIGIGATIQYYSNRLFSRYEIWAEINFGLRYGYYQDSKRSSDGLYQGKQSSLLFPWGIGLNLWRKDMTSLFPRTQFQFVSLVPLSQEKNGYWNGNKIANSGSWDMLYCELSLKQSLVNIRMVNAIWLTPKIIGFYSYSEGNQENCLGWGLELSVHRSYRDDYLSLYIVNKQYVRSGETITVGLLSNISTFFF